MVAVFGLGPIGQMSARIARHRGLRVIGIDTCPAARARQRHGIDVIDGGESNEGVGDAIRDGTDGRGADSAIDAVGMEAQALPSASSRRRPPV